LIRSYRGIEQDPDSVIGYFQNYSKDHSHEFFELVRQETWLDFYDDEEIAARMIYLNRACYNGLYRVNKKGKFNSPWGKRESVRIDENNIYAVSQALKHTTLVQGDFASVLGHVCRHDFVLIDPPYPDGFTQYTSIGFDESDHRRLHEVCIRLNRQNVMWMQTNADCDYIRNLYKDFQIVPVAARRNINCKGDGRGNVGELLIMNY